MFECSPADFWSEVMEVEDVDPCGAFSLTGVCFTSVDSATCAGGGSAGLGTADIFFGVMEETGVPPDVVEVGIFFGVVEWAGVTPDAVEVGIFLEVMEGADATPDAVEVGLSFMNACFASVDSDGLLGFEDDPTLVDVGFSFTKVCFAFVRSSDCG